MKHASRRRVALFAVGMLILALAVRIALAVVDVQSRASQTSSPRMLLVQCRSPALGGTVPAAVYLPAGYRTGNRRYPVVYFLHGLPAGPNSYTTNSFVARAVAGAGERAIVVAPQGARTAASDREYLNWGRIEDWPVTISRDIPHCIDSRFRTLPSRRGRALIGLSAGGGERSSVPPPAGSAPLISGCATSGGLLRWSRGAGTSPPRIRQGFGNRISAPPAPIAKREFRAGRHLVRRLARWPSFIALYVGRDDNRFLSANIMLDRALTRHQIPHLFRSYAGAHSGSLWLAQAPFWLRLALNHLRASA